MGIRSRLLGVVLAVVLAVPAALAIEAQQGGPSGATVTVGAANATAEWVPSACGCLPPGLRVSTANGTPTDLTAEELIGKSLTTTDGVRVGTIAIVAEGQGGAPVAVIDLEAGVIAGVTRIGVHLGTTRLVAGRNLRLETDAADLVASVTAATAPVPAA